jgi:hypothetical protein
MKKILLSTLLTVFFASAIAQADRYDRRWHQAHWGEGHWIHDRHAGRLGWWWVIGDDWHFYAHPVAQPQMVIIQQPAPVMIQPAPVMVGQPAPVMAAPAQVITPTMYYCKATETYYPQTMTCPNGWTPVTAGAPPSP